MRIIVNNKTDEFHDADDWALYESEWPLDLDVIRENGDDPRTFGDSITSSLGNPNVHVAEDMAATDGHQHVVMFVDNDVRNALRNRLHEPDMLGVGYSAFLTRAIRLSRDLHDIIARAAHEAAVGLEGAHGYGCDHTPGRQPACEEQADVTMAAEGSWTR